MEIILLTSEKVDFRKRNIWDKERKFHDKGSIH